MTLPPVGVRVSLRHMDAGGAHDLVGQVQRVERAGDPAVVVLPWDRGEVRVPASTIVAWRRVPPRAVRPSSTAADVARRAGEGWPGTTEQRLGGWRLHSGDGWSARANHTLPEGDPGCPLEEALDRVVAFHAGHGTTPRLMLLDGSPGAGRLAPSLARRGWHVEQACLVMVCDLRRLPAGAGSRPGPTMQWQTHPSAEWLDLVGRPHPSREAVLTACPAHYLGVRLDGALVAIARAVVSADWLGVSCVQVLEELRGRGIGSQLMGEVARRGRELGARFGYLQVTADNLGARRLYDNLGWREHHRYEYSVPGVAAQPAVERQDVTHE